MKLTSKLFISHSIVLVTVLLILTIVISIIVPADFSSRMGPQSTGRGNTQMGMMMGSHMQEVDAVRGAVTTALLWSAIIAIIMTGTVSWFISRRIVKPIQELVELSRHISTGHYDKRLNVSSDDELGDLIRSFNHMAETLEATEVMRRQLMGDITHELKTPLSSIKGYMEGLQDNILPAEPQTFQLIYREATRLQRLVEDLQELSRVEARQIPIHLSACDPVELVASTVEKLKPQFISKDIRLQIDYVPSLPHVLADFERTEQVLMNLIGNALQYTPTGGEVVIRVKPQEKYIYFSVEDTGIGLQAEELERVFQRFYRVDKSRSRASGGSGIGLTISRHLIELQGGKLWAESAGLDQGSIFYFSLPIV